MKSRLITHPKLKKPLRVYYVVSDSEFEEQISEIWENEVYSSFKPKDGVFLDVGANTGMATLYFHYVLGAKEIHSIEPNPEIYKALRRNVKDIPSIRTYNVAWANANTVGMMFSNREEHLAQTLMRDGREVKTQKITCVTPLTFFRRADIEHVDVMKIDVEGSEYIIFPDEGFCKVSKNIDCIIGESHYIEAGGFPEIIPELLKPLGFTTEYLKLPIPNMYRTFSFTDIETGDVKRFQVTTSTIFKAWRR